MDSAKKLLALDVGTTAVKVGLFNPDLSLDAIETLEYQLITPKTDHIEMEPETYWSNAVKGVRRVLEETKTGPEDIRVITCATQGETLIPVDENGNALHRAIVWLDARAREEAAEINEAFPPEVFHRKTGLPEINAYYPAAKLLWLKRNLPEVYEKAHKILLLEDYLLSRLSGRFVSNPAVMCSTGYFDIVENRIWDEMTDRFELDPKKIPEVLPCGTLIGTLCGQAAAELGLSEKTPVSTGAMDQMASAVGSGNVSCGTISETTGTAQVIAATVDEPCLEKWSPVTTYSHAVPGKYLLVHISQTAGIILKWFRNEFCRDLMDEGHEDVFQYMDKLAEGVPPLSGGLTLFPHFTGVNTPVPDEQARGVFFGVGLDTGRDHFIRAILEGVAYALKEGIELMGPAPEKLISLGGGSKSDVWNRIKADVCGLDITVMENEESTLLGAAILGGIASGLFPDIYVAVDTIRSGKAYKPDAAATAAYGEGYEKYKKMYELFKPLF